MKTLPVAPTPASGLRRCCRALAQGVLALGLTAWGAVDACPLDPLLQLPLEHLLALRIGAQRAAHRSGPPPTGALPTPGGASHAA